MRILVFPRDDLNPYQRLLYDEMGRLGARVTYLGRLTPSHTLNLLLLPAELTALLQTARNALAEEQTERAIAIAETVLAATPLPQRPARRG